MSDKLNTTTDYYFAANMGELKVSKDTSGQPQWIDAQSFEIYSAREMQEFLDNEVIIGPEAADERMNEIAAKAARIALTKAPALVGEHVFMGSADGEEFYFVLLEIIPEMAAFLVENLHHLNFSGEEEFVEGPVAISFGGCDELRPMNSSEHDAWLSEWENYKKEFPDFDEVSGAYRSKSISVSEDLFTITKDEKADKKKVVDEPTPLPSDYDPTFVNASMELSELADKMDIALSKDDKPDCISILMSGVPGVGKSLSAKWLAKELGMDIHIKPLASLLDKWIGATEKNIKEAFDEAAESEAILVIDEVDAISGSRDNSDRNHQISMVNALLQALDSFKGICVFTTNSTERMDNAVLRRCLLEIEFKNLTDAQADRMANKFFPRRKIKGLANEVYAPADFAKVKDQLLFVANNKINKKFLMKQLAKTATTRGSKDVEQGEKIQMGFNLSN